MSGLRPMILSLVFCFSEFCSFITCLLAFGAVLGIVFPFSISRYYSFAAFKIISSSLVFRSLAITYLGVNFFELSLLGFTQLLGSVGLCVLPNWGHFQLLSLQALFQICRLPSFPPWLR